MLLKSELRASTPHSYSVTAPAAAATTSTGPSVSLDRRRVLAASSSRERIPVARHQSFSSGQSAASSSREEDVDKGGIRSSSVRNTRHPNTFKQDVVSAVTVVSETTSSARLGRGFRRVEVQQQQQQQPTAEQPRKTKPTTDNESQIGSTVIRIGAQTSSVVRSDAGSDKRGIGFSGIGLRAKESRKTTETAAAFDDSSSSDSDTAEPVITVRRPRSIPTLPLADNSSTAGTEDTAKVDSDDDNNKVPAAVVNVVGCIESQKSSWSENSDELETGDTEKETTECKFLEEFIIFVSF